MAALFAEGDQRVESEGVVHYGDWVFLTPLAHSVEGRKVVAYTCLTVSRWTYSLVRVLCQ